MALDLQEAQYWIDTDPGVDDAIAILLAIREVGEQLIGFSTVQGNAPEPTTALNLERVLRAARISGIAPDTWDPVIARGSATSLLGKAYCGERKYAYHGNDGLANVSWEPNSNWEFLQHQIAAQAIIENVMRRPGLRLLFIGPLTNLALAIRLAPKIVESVDALVIMGGSLRAGGNETMAAEFNFTIDAEAAQMVLHAGFKDIRLIPIDACDEARLSLANFQRIAETSSPIAKLICELTKHWKPLLLEGRTIPIYDAVAWLALNHPTLIKWESVYVGVDTSGGLAHGASIADWRNRTKNAPNVQAAIGISDRTALLDLFFSLLS